MEKLLIRLNVPAVQQHYDILVPQELSVEVLTKLLADGVAELSSGRYEVSRQEMLTMEPNILLHPAHKLMEYGVRDGDQLILL